MNCNPTIIMKNLGTFTNAYGLASNGERLVEGILNTNDHIEGVGILLRDPVTKQGLISCKFPVAHDITGTMVWVPSDGRALEAVPIYRREVCPENQLKPFHNRLNADMNGGHYFLIGEGDFHLRVHYSLRKEGVIESYNQEKGYGFIRRSRKGIFFMKKWSNVKEIKMGEEVSFVPIISHRGPQARAIEETGA